VRALRFHAARDLRIDDIQRVGHERGTAGVIEQDVV